MKCFIMTLLITIIILIFSENMLSFDLKFKNVKEKTKNILLENWKKTRGISQVGPKPNFYLDYPGLSIEKLNTNKKLWNLYYKCLEELQNNINKQNIFQAKVITTFRSSVIK